MPLSPDVGAVDHHDHIITEEEMLIHHDTPMYEPVPPRARRLASVEEMVAVQRTLLGEVTALRSVQEELLKVEGERLALEKEKFAMEKRRRLED
ncbi:unnamed protein product [Coregonus sp. 'balchen']|nr:unnamed protein product [Coregonus sp. 'balchen']